MSRPVAAMRRPTDWGRIARPSVLVFGLAGVAVCAAVQPTAAYARAAQAPTQEAPGVTLADAAEMRDGELIRSLLQGGAGVDVKQVDGMTALHWAVYHDDAEMTRRRPLKEGKPSSWSPLALEASK